MPDLALHERPRAKKMKMPDGPRGRSKAVHVSKQTSIPISQRLTEFPKNGLTESCGKLYCRPCRTVLDNIKSSIADHVGRKKHIDALRNMESRDKEDASLKQELSEYFYVNTDERGSSTNADTHMFRYRCVEAFLGTGTPLERLEKFKKLLERSGISITSPSDMRIVYIPRIEKHEIRLLKRDVQNQFVAAPFDGTTRLGEVICQTVRWCDDNFVIHTQLLTVKTTKTHVNASQLASLLTSSLITEMGIDASRVVALPRDSCSTNGAAIRLMLNNPFYNATDIMCICHILNCMGERIRFPLLQEFMTPWLDLVGGREPHAGAKGLWSQMVAPQSVPGYSKVRWWSKAEIQFLMAENVDKLLPFVRMLRDRDIGDATTMKMLEILRTKGSELHLELAAMLDIRALVRTTYDLEGDRLEILLVHERIETLRELGRRIIANDDGVLPNVDAFLRSTIKLQRGVQIVKAFAGFGCYDGVIESEAVVESTLYPGQERVAYRVHYPADNTTEDLELEELRPLVKVLHMPERKRISAALAPAFQYLENRIMGTCDDQYDASTCYEVFRLVRVFDPEHAKQHLTSSWVDMLLTIPSLANLVDRNQLKLEIHRYLSLAATFTQATTDVSTYTTAILHWWSINSQHIPEWGKAAKIVFAFTPNSASVERVFAAMRNLFDVTQIHSLSDLVRASLMLHCNDRVLG